VPDHHVQVLNGICPVARRARIKFEDFGPELVVGLVRVDPGLGSLPKAFCADVEVPDSRLLPVLIIRDLVEVE
jgi:hypothetical protein